MKLTEKIKQYRLEFKHLTVLFIVLIAFQIILSLLHKFTLQSSLTQTQDWYQKDSAEKLANVTATSIELLMETVYARQTLTENEQRSVITGLNIILSQQMLGRNAKEICIIVTRNGKTYAIDDGAVLFTFLTKGTVDVSRLQKPHIEAIMMYDTYGAQIRKKEEIYSILEGRRTFHTFVPFVPRGEFVGLLYMKNTPDFSVITSSFVSNYDETSMINSSLMFFGLLAMYFVSSYTVRERDSTQRLFYEEHEKLLKEQIAHDKESVFTRRIYHTHHKAEKVMAFIKEDLLSLSMQNIDTVKYRITKYANFISRVIYDMKWYDPPIHTIRNQVYQTDINEVIRFIVNNLFSRLSKASSSFSFHLELAENLPFVHINEFVVWEILEPLMQNSINHSNVYPVEITVSTSYDHSKNESVIVIKDNGQGLRPDLLEANSDGVKNIFLENIPSKQKPGQQYGYGCFIAYDLATVRCGWMLDARNDEEGGCRFIITINH